jgi:DMSO/TMAO reductase YedYZ molybdopterin-dependent catalytic subunit
MRVTSPRRSGPSSGFTTVGKFSKNRGVLRVEGEVRRPGEFSFEDLAALPGQIADVASLVPGRAGSAVRFQSVLEAASVSEAASRVTLESADGKFSQQAPLAALRTALLVYRLGEAPLPPDKGGPVRFLIPNLEECETGGVDRCTNVKALRLVRIE